MQIWTDLEMIIWKYIPFWLENHTLKLQGFVPLINYYKRKKVRGLSWLHTHSIDFSFRLCSSQNTTPLPQYWTQQLLSAFSKETSSLYSKTSKSGEHTSILGILFQWLTTTKIISWLFIFSIFWFKLCRQFFLMGFWTTEASVQHLFKSRETLLLITKNIEPSSELYITLLCGLWDEY